MSRSRRCGHAAKEARLPIAIPCPPYQICAGETAQAIFDSLPTDMSILYGLRLFMLILHERTSPCLI